MDATAYRRLMVRVEELTRRDPAAVRRQARWLVALASVYVGGVLTVVVGVAVALLVVGQNDSGNWGWPYALVPIVFAAVIVHALAVPQGRLRGMRVARASAPRLHALVERIAREVGAPLPDAVVLTDDFNASALETSRFGAFGVRHRELGIGIPLLCSLTETEFEAVLAHEFGHFASTTMRHGQQLHRTSLAWTRLMENMEGTGAWAMPIFRRFFAWFIPRLTARAIVLRRLDEFDADADAARVTGARITASTLVAIATRGRYFASNPWITAAPSPAGDPELPSDAWSSLPARMRAFASSAERRRMLALELRRDPQPDDTHPTLSARLRALGVGASDGGLTIAEVDALLLPLEEHAGTELLGDVLARRLEALDEEWRERFEAAWTAEVRQFGALRRRREQLDAAERAGDRLSADEAAERMLLVATLEGAEAAASAALAVIDTDEAHVRAHLVLAEAKASALDPSAIGHFERVIALEPWRRPAMLEAMYRLHDLRGDAVALAEIDRRERECEAGDLAAAAERALLLESDRFERPELPDHLIDALRTAGMQARRLSRFLVARKVLHHQPAEALHVIVLVPDRGTRMIGYIHDDFVADFAALISEPLPDTMFVIGVGEYAWLPRRLDAEGTALVFQG